MRGRITLGRPLTLNAEYMSPNCISDYQEQGFEAGSLRSLDLPWSLEWLSKAVGFGDGAFTVLFIQIIPVLRKYFSTYRVRERKYSLMNIHQISPSSSPCFSKLFCYLYEVEQLQWEGDRDLGCYYSDENNLLRKGVLKVWNLPLLRWW